MIPISSIETRAEPEDVCRPLSRIIWPSDEHLINPRWRTETAIGLALAIRDSNDVSILPILADALEDAGCENHFVLNHCRYCNKHLRSCWVVSAVLMKPKLLAEKPVIPSFPSTPISIPGLSGRITFLQPSVPISTSANATTPNEPAVTREAFVSAANQVFEGDEIERSELIETASGSEIDRLEMYNYEKKQPVVSHNKNCRIYLLLVTSGIIRNSNFSLHCSGYTLGLAIAIHNIEESILKLWRGKYIP